VLPVFYEIKLCECANANRNDRLYAYTAVYNVGKKLGCWEMPGVAALTDGRTDGRSGYIMSL